MGRLLPALIVCVSGCATVPDTARELPQANAQVELTDTPYHPQERYQCGPAALTTVLEASGAAVTLDEVTDRVYIPGRKGSLQLELLAATRTAGRLPYVIDTSLGAILGELEAGRPVLVLQNLGVAAIPRWHYAVVIGVDGARDSVILRSGTDRRRETQIDLFLRTWSRGDFWGFVALPPAELPANVDRDRYFSSIVGLEQADMWAEAAVAWETALRHWPADTTALFGLGNARLALDDVEGAAHSYRELLAINPGLAVARNNLAMALARQQRFDEALEEIERALALDPGDSVEAILLETRSEIVMKAE
jgi:hypothetical protein